MNRAAKTLSIALLISLLIHLSLTGLFPEVKWTESGRKNIVLEAEIAAPRKPVDFKPLAPPKPGAVPKTPEPVRPTDGNLSEPRSAPVAESSPQPAEAQSAPPPVEKPAEKKGVEVPRHAKLTFRVFRGSANVGMAVHTWDILDDGRYVITNKVEAIGIFALFVSGAMAQVSEGHVTDEGLRPDLYTITRGSMQNQQAAHFDWKAMKLDLSSNGNPRQEKLDPLTQDQLSFLYQFAYTPPKSGIFSFVATDGRKLDTYDYEILGEETILTGTTKTRTLHLKKLHEPGVEGTEIWLDEDRYYWPVQVVMTDKNGDVMKQVISEIEVK